MKVSDKNVSKKRLVQLENSGIPVYPNPANEFVTIGFGNQMTGSSIIQLYDIQGKEIIRKKITGFTQQLDMGSVRAGVCYLRITTGEKIITWKITKI
ncbi:MAG: T9SS type A sorting domain-containing protein [candidate division Zixibacteria bacterium]|nr:T9SS type A sorting domain-containing protein [candidate division Zixibacteria bacterium]